MKLYGSLASPYVARVVMFADLKGISLNMESAPGGMGSDDYKSINPTGKIPSLEIDGTCIAESTTICDYLESVNPEPSLIPKTPMLLAHSRMIARMTDLYIAPHNSPLTRMRSSGNRDQAIIDQQAAEFAKGFGYLEHFMGSGPFAAGDTPSLGDCALAPFIVMLKQSIFSNFEEVTDPTEAGGRLQIWWEAIQNNDVCKKNIDAYDVALAEFLKWLYEMLAKRASN
ncbi:MAG: glutathione S-transferase family protein [Pseudomonadota bacterium]|nr:glutathione S-transferase family protein [Pseudomonadota bacterium]